MADEAGIASVRPGDRFPNRFCLPLVERNVRLDGFGRKPGLGALCGVSKFIELRDGVGIESKRHRPRGRGNSCFHVPRLTQTGTVPKTC